MTVYVDLVAKDTLYKILVDVVNHYFKSTIQMQNLDPNINQKQSNHNLEKRKALNHNLEFYRSSSVRNLFKKAHNNDENSMLDNISSIQETMKENEEEILVKKLNFNDQINNGLNEYLINTNNGNPSDQDSNIVSNIPPPPFDYQEVKPMNQLNSYRRLSETMAKIKEPSNEKVLNEEEFNIGNDYINNIIGSSNPFVERKLDYLSPDQIAILVENSLFNQKNVRDAHKFIPTLGKNSIVIIGTAFRSGAATFAKLVDLLMNQMENMPQIINQLQNGSHGWNHFKKILNL